MSQSPKIAVVLSGCGHLDGAEIRESIFTLLALDQAGAQVKVFAPDADQHHVINHRKGEETAGEKRHILTEAARLTRGDVSPLTELNPEQFNGLVIPGGFGVAKNLCTFAFKGASCDVMPQVQKVIEGFYELKKPIAALCIAPVLVAKVLGKHQVTVTIGTDKETASEIEKTGARHQDCKVSEYVQDKDHNLFTTPAYMYGEAKISEVHRGVDSCLKAFLTAL